MSDSFMVWSFWILTLAALAYALYSTTLPDEPDAMVADEDTRG